MRVAQLGRHVETELVRVLDGRIAEADAVDAALLEQLLEEQRLECGVELLADVLEEHGLAVLDRGLERAQVVAVRQLEYVQIGRRLHRAHPLVRLPLRVNHEGPAAGVEHDNAVVHRESIGREPLDVPLADLDRIAEGVGQGRFVGARDGVLLALHDP